MALEDEFLFRLGACYLDNKAYSERVAQMLLELKDEPSVEAYGTVADFSFFEAPY